MVKIFILLIIIFTTAYYTRGRHFRDIIKPKTNIIEKWLEKIDDLEHSSCAGQLLSFIIHLLIIALILLIFMGGALLIIKIRKL